MRWIIGDIHGMLGSLQTLLQAVRRADPDPHFCFAGDYVNRGPDSSGVIEWLLRLPNARFIRGNHDDIFDQVLNGTSYTPNASDGDRLLAFQWFMQHGLAETLASYGIDWGQLDALAERPSERGLDAALEAIPRRHRQFIRELPAVIEEEDFFVAHGYFKPGAADRDPGLAQRLESDRGHRNRLLWGRFEPEEIRAPKQWQRCGYFGHTPVENYAGLLPNGQCVPIRGERIVLLDTGAALSPFGRLTAFCHETGQYVQAGHYGNLVTPSPVGS